MSELIEHCCDVCGDKEKTLLTLNPSYRSNVVNSICGDCAHVMDEFQSNVRSLMKNQECSLVKLFMRKKRRDKFKGFK